MGSGGLRSCFCTIARVFTWAFRFELTVSMVSVRIVPEVAPALYTDTAVTTGMPIPPGESVLRCSVIGVRVVD